jgi:hypothetical protein
MRLEKRLLRRIVKRENNGCWMWTGSRTSHGYGNIVVSGKLCMVHRLAHKLWVGPIPQGYWVRHRCGNPACCNPEHLYTSAGTASLEERLLGKINKQEGGCWIWQGYTEKGYGRIETLSHRQVVHRVAYELWVEPIPKASRSSTFAITDVVVIRCTLLPGRLPRTAQYKIDCRRRASPICEA